MNPSFSSDFFGVWRVCGLGVALRWLGHLLLNVRQVVKTRRLHVGDRGLDTAVLKLSYGKAQAIASEPRLFGGVREIWVRDVYLNHGFLQISEDDMVVDLGANVGVFTLLAVAHGAKVLSIECNREHAPAFERLMHANRAADRVRLHHVFVGKRHQVQDELLANIPSQCAEEWWTADDLVKHLGGRRINLLKCDIEGSEFDLFEEDSILFKVVDQIGIEIHADVGDPEKLLALFQRKGYEVTVYRVFDGGVIAQARRPRTV